VADTRLIEIDNPDLAELILKIKSVKASPASPDIPEGRRVYIPKNDPAAEKITLSDKPLSKLLGTAFYLVYQDEEGQLGERRITAQFVYKKSGTEDIYIRAFCHETNAVRTFNVKQIVEVVDPATDQVVQDEKVILKAFALIANEGEPEKLQRTVNALKEHSAALNVLKFLACCDEHYCSAEEEIIIHFMMNECFMQDLDETFMLDHIRRLYPDRLTYYRSVEILTETPRTLVTVIKYAKQLIEADGFISENEASFILELQLEKDNNQIDEWVELELENMVGVGPIKIHK